MSWYCRCTSLCPACLHTDYAAEGVVTINEAGINGTIRFIPTGIRSLSIEVKLQGLEGLCMKLEVCFHVQNCISTPFIAFCINNTLVHDMLGSLFHHQELQVLHTTKFTVVKASPLKTVLSYFRHLIVI